MKICIVDSLKRRNNAVSNLVIGLRQGFQSIDQDFYVIKYESEKVINPKSITPDTDVIIIPYWIGKEAFYVNMHEVQFHHPNAKICLLNGTSPFWHGCEWIDYHPVKRSLTPNLGHFNKNIEVIDTFFVVTARPGVKPVNQVEVGMGILPELKCGPKMKYPNVILDFLKRGWDDAAYEDAVNTLNRLAEDVPDLTVVVLGSNPLTALLSNKIRSFAIPHDLNQFEQMVELWSKSWAFICHNESFGYCLVESFISGTQVFTSPKSEIPRVHTQTDVRVKPLEELRGHLLDWSSKTVAQRQQAALRIKMDYTNAHPQFCSWENMCRKIVFHLEQGAVA